MPTLTTRMARLMLRNAPIYNGQGRIIHRSWLRDLSFAEKSMDVATKDGFVVRVDPNDFIGRHVYLTGRFERSVADALVHFSRPGDVMWDIGSNLGYMSCAFLARVPKSRVVAVDPQVGIVTLLRHNLSQFPADRWTVVNAAVSDSVGEGRLVITEGNLGRSHLSEGGTGDSVRLVTGAELAAAAAGQSGSGGVGGGQGGGGVNVIKIDVEGHEAAVFRGIRSSLAAFHPRSIVFEHWPEGPQVDRGIVELLEAEGYLVTRIVHRWNGWKLARHDKPNPRYKPSPNCLAVHVPSLSDRSLLDRMMV